MNKVSHSLFEKIKKNTNFASRTLLFFILLLPTIKFFKNSNFINFFEQKLLVIMSSPYTRLPAANSSHPILYIQFQNGQSIPINYYNEIGKINGPSRYRLGFYFELNQIQKTNPPYYYLNHWVCSHMKHLSPKEVIFQERHIRINCSNL